MSCGGLCAWLCAVSTWVSNQGEQHPICQRRSQATAGNTSGHLRPPRDVNRQCYLSPFRPDCYFVVIWGYFKDSKETTKKTTKYIFINNNTASY